MKRIVGFDSLRFYMVLCVIMLHGAMSYMAYVPQWWYAINPQNSAVFTALVIILDSFPMSVLFFLAGYFAAPSFDKRGAKSFLKDKAQHIALPWLLGIIFVAPFFAYSSMISFGLPPLPVDIFISKMFFGPFYQQAVYWFLMVLFAFFVLFAIFRRAFDAAKCIKKLSPLCILILFIVSTLPYILSVLYLKPAAEWLNIGFFLYFQPARIVGYIALFVLGYAAFANAWFDENKKQSLSAPAFFCLGSIILMILRTFVYAPVLTPLQNIVLEAVLYNAVSISATFFLTACFLRKGSESLSVKLSKYSYSIYWLHQIVLMPSVAFLSPYNIPIALKWALAVLWTVFVCALISKYIFKKTPILKEIF